MTETLLDSTAVYCLSPDCRYRKVFDEGLILRQSAGEVLVSNPVGARVMDLLDGTNPVGAILDRLVSELTVDRDTAERDLAAFLRGLLDDGVIEPRGSAIE
jgi:hypothetical protein